MLATPLIEKLRLQYPDATIDFLLRKGNEKLLTGHPHLRQVLIFDKRKGKYLNLLKLIRQLRREKYDYVINAQRFFASGLMTVFSGAKQTIGFDKNPLSAFFSRKIPHHISSTAVGEHEVKRNLTLIHHITDPAFVGPKLYPSDADFEKIKPTSPYICIAPASVWFTKQFPKEGWIDLIQALPDQFTIYLLGAKSDDALCKAIQSAGAVDTFNSPDPRLKEEGRIRNLAGQLSFLESAALMKNAAMNYVNDSAPLHFASAVNAPVTAIFCSTVPAFGFGPLSDQSFIVEAKIPLNCRPCGLHGKHACPLSHFKCSMINTEDLLATLVSS